MRGGGRRAIICHMKTNAAKTALFSALLITALLCSSCAPAGTMTSTPSPVQGDWDNTPKVLVPTAPGRDARGNDSVTLDVSNVSQGYIVLTYTGSNGKVRMQITRAGGETYTYVVATDGSSAVFPLSDGDGEYTINIFENVEGSNYLQLYGTAVTVALDDGLLPFLYPNQYVDFDIDDNAVALGADLASGCADELTVVESIYNYIVSHISYDTEKARTVTTGYLPDIDEVIETGRGICFDYASLTTAMLRSQGIPTKLVVGYADTAYHAWISVWTDELGWVDNIIEFNGDEWVRMDPTFAAGQSIISRYTEDGIEYNDMYYY